MDTTTDFSSISTVSVFYGVAKHRLTSSTEQPLDTRNYIHTHRSWAVLYFRRYISTSSKERPDME